MLVLDSTNPRAFAGVLRRLRTELTKLPGRDDWHGAFLALLPAEGAGLTLDDLRNADDRAITAQLLALSARLQDAALALADQIGARYFTLAHGADQRV